MIKYYPKKTAIRKINAWGQTKTPFYFITSFDTTKNILIRANQIGKSGIKFSFGDFRYSTKRANVILSKTPVPFSKYLASFNTVLDNIKRGNTFLANLTFETPIDIDLSLNDIFELSCAKYKLLLPNQFVVFSPETFIKIRDNMIYSYPMKGTIDASIKNAKVLLLKNQKEKAEHATIVDLIRNDLSIYANNVKVPKFRYIEEINSGSGSLLQVSSEVSGELKSDVKNNLGDLFFSLLPAGSISGAPKDKTLKIIGDSEIYKRGFYTGVAGYYDGINLDSFVLIRYIEQNDQGKFIYKSGGGITHLSDPIEEYKELLDKIYVPIS